MTSPIQLPESGPEGAMWTELLDISEQHPKGWTIVGALMVALHALGGGMSMARKTRDIDTVVEVRGVTAGTREFSQVLVGLGWDIPADTVGSDGIGHRFVKNNLKLDLLAPEGLGERADLTTLPPLVTVPIPGATQALRRTVTQQVSLGSRTGVLPVPNLVGAIVIKSCAAAATAHERGHHATRHRDDLALLYALVDDPRPLAAAVEGKDRRRLRRAGEPNWPALPTEFVADAKAAHAIIVR